MDIIMTDEYFIVEQIIRNISHEIKNPLTIMKGYTQLLSSGVNDAAVVQKSQKMVLEQIERINETFDHLYSTFSIATTGKDEVDIVEVISDYIHNLPGETSSRVQFYTDSEIFRVNCDKERFNRLLYCIVQGFDWKNNPDVQLDVVLEENETTDVSFNFRKIDFSQILEKIFYLPFSSTQYFNTGTELYEVYCITHSQGWTFKAFVDLPDSVFTITLN